jgi:hypothetical protein
MIKFFFFFSKQKCYVEPRGRKQNVVYSQEKGNHVEYIVLLDWIQQQTVE